MMLSTQTRSLSARRLIESFAIRGHGRSHLSSTRSFHRSATVLEDEAEHKVDRKEEALRNRMAAIDFNNRRAAYKRQVTDLRRRYAEQVQAQRAADLAEEEARERELTRRRLERQRRKNVRSAENAVRQKQLREQRANEFEEHLRVMQLKRGAKNEMFAKARQLVIDELEEEAPLWLTTAEEVEAAFTPEAEQLLWARPGGVLGAPNPSLDAHFWEFETHTWHMEKTYKSQRQVLLEELEEIAYEEANIDKNVWTDERMEQERQLEEKARLRAMVHSAGRLELLRKQKQMLEEESATAPGEIPKPKPVPNPRMLRDDRAIEREGAKLLNEDPTKFFVFDGLSSCRNEEDEEESAETSGYSGPTLGSPTGLRDPLREGSHQGKVFPDMIGRIPKPDTRTEREKKQEEREQRMLAAAQLEAESRDQDIELAAQQRTLEDLQPDLNYDEHEWDDEDDGWKKGLDPVADAEILNTPRERRYKEEDLEWVLNQLEGKVRHLEQQFGQEVESIKQTMDAELRSKAKTGETMEESSLEAALMSLSEKDLLALSDLDDRFEEGMTDEELSAAVKEINGLTEEQVKSMILRDRSMD